MLVVMQAQATEDQVRAVCQKIESLGYRPHSMPGAQRTAIGITGNKGEVEAGSLEEMPGVQEVIRVSKPYKLVSRDTKPDNTVIKFPNSPVTIGGKDLAIVAGPCGIESRDQARRLGQFFGAQLPAKIGGRRRQLQHLELHFDRGRPPAPSHGFRPR